MNRQEKKVNAGEYGDKKIGESQMDYDMVSIEEESD
jgi:hypothetical protein